MRRIKIILFILEIELIGLFFEVANYTILRARSKTDLIRKINNENKKYFMRIIQLRLPNKSKSDKKDN